MKTLITPQTSRQCGDPIDAQNGTPFDAKRTVDMLSALAQETRLALFRLLVRHGKNSLATGDIARLLDIPNSTLSYHLAELERAGLINSTKQQRQIIYAANLDCLDSLLSFLIEDCCQSDGGSCLPYTKKTIKAYTKKTIKAFTKKTIKGAKSCL